MTENNSVTLEALLRFALPLGTTLLAGASDTPITWAVTVRAQPPAFPDVYGGELALVSMNILHSYDDRITLAEVIANLARAGVGAIAADGDVVDEDIATANELNVSLLSLSNEDSITRIERSVNSLILNRSAQLTQRAVEIQRQLTRLAAENRDINSLLQIIARTTARPIIAHDDAGVLIARVAPGVARNGLSARATLSNLPDQEFQQWLATNAPNNPGAIVTSPLGYTTVLKAEKRVAGYLSLITSDGELDEFDRLVLAYGADVCAIEIAKSRAIAYAVEQARGDWVQMWLSSTPADDDMMSSRAAQAGFEIGEPHLAVVFRATTQAGIPLPLENLTSLLRDDVARRGLNTSIGQHVDVLVALYPLDDPSRIGRISQIVDEARELLASRTPSGKVAAGISRPGTGLSELREAYREAKDAVNIAAELGEREQTTFYGDLKLYQLLLALKEHGLSHLRRFYEETLAQVVEHDERKQGELIRTLEGFFEANGNLAKAANDLNIHRNTLVYRLDRVKELTGLDLDDAENRLILHLALKIERVLATMGKYTP